MKSGSLQEEFAPYAPLRGSSTGVVAPVEERTSSVPRTSSPKGKTELWAFGVQKIYHLI